LKEILGHHSVGMTEKYAHLRPELFTPDDRAVLVQGAQSRPFGLRGGARKPTPSGPHTTTIRTDEQNAGAVL
jgi:hypothetical protein